MWGFLLAAVNTLLGFAFRTVAVKFVVYGALFFITTEFIGLIGGMLPTSGAISGALGGIPASVWFFLDIFNFSAGLPLILSAYVTRFIIRRIPVIG